MLFDDGDDNDYDHEDSNDYVDIMIKLRCNLTSSPMLFDDGDDNDDDYDDSNDYDDDEDAISHFLQCCLRW